MAAVIDVQIRGQYTAAQAFAALQQDAIKAGQFIGDFAARASVSFNGLVTGLADLRAGLDIAVQAAEQVKIAFDETVGATVAYAAQVRELSRTIGATAEEASMLIQAADDMGVSFQSVQTAMEAAIRKGVSPSIDGIARLADQYNAIQDPIARSKFLMDTFGRSGADLAQLMEQGSVGIRDLGAAAREAGLVLDQEAVAAAREYELQLDAMNDAIEAAKIKIGVDLLPAVTSTIDVNMRAASAIDDNGLAWTRLIPPLGAVVELFNLTAAAVSNSGAKAEAASKSIASAQAQLQAFSSYAGSVPVVGHGTSYQAGSGPAYPWSESNPTGYRMDPRTGAKTYPGADGDATTPGRAGGGPGLKGMTYRVAEDGTEYLTLGQNGYFTPAGAASASGEVSVNLNMPSMFNLSDTGRAKQVLTPIIRDAVRELKRNGEI